MTVRFCARTRNLVRCRFLFFSTFSLVLQGINQGIKILSITHDNLNLVTSNPSIAYSRINYYGADTVGAGHYIPLFSNSPHPGLTTMLDVVIPSFGAMSYCKTQCPRYLATSSHNPTLATMLCCQTIPVLVVPNVAASLAQTSTSHQCITTQQRP
ncbi:hypothetical protein BC827DRAFT_78977 [Russula dissimulans]|nr:hypothetical protein BC827DRAFT_78977 [Russula dissimulans]